MIVFSPEFKKFASQAHLAGRLQYRGVEIFYYAVEAIGPKDAYHVASFLKEILSSKISNEDIMEMWVRSQTYTSLLKDIRPFTQGIIDVIENPRAPVHPEE